MHSGSNENLKKKALYVKEKGSKRPLATGVLYGPQKGLHGVECEKGGGGQQIALAGL
jgi:hypothetical protein